MLKNYATPILCTILLGLAIYGMWLGMKLAYDNINPTITPVYADEKGKL